MRGLSSLRPGLFHDAWHRDFPALPGFQERGHVVAAPLAAAVEPLVDQTLGEPCEPAVAFRIPDHSVVVPHTPQLVLERGDDLREREAPRFLQPVLERLEAVAELLGVGHTSHPPILRIVPASPPEEVEAEEGELPAALRFPPVELHQRALLVG